LSFCQVFPGRSLESIYGKCTRCRSKGPDQEYPSRRKWKEKESDILWRTKVEEDLKYDEIADKLSRPYYDGRDFRY
jgi:hypothetical protein